MTAPLAVAGGLAAVAVALAMPAQVDWLLDLAARIPIWSIYLLLGVGAAVENVIPLVPSDTFVLIGAVLAERGVLEPRLVLASAWTGNVSAALGVYAMGRRYGRGLFHTAWGRRLLRPHQLQRLSDFYGRYGLFSIFAVRFFPVFRALDPVFAGISGLRFWKAALPLGLAGALWYGILLYFGMLLSRNLARLFGAFERVNLGLLAGALLLAVAVAVWWWRSRRGRDNAGET